MGRTKTPLPSGWHKDISFEDYLAFDAWHGGEALAILRTTPAHVAAARAEPAQPRDPQAFGTLAHCAVLEPGELSARYAVLPEGDGRTAAVRDAKAKIVESGRTAVKPADYAGAQRIRQLLVSHPIAGPALMRRDGLREVTGSFRDPWVGLPCLMRPDLALFAMGLCVDMKTAEDVSPRGFNAAVFMWGYHVKAAFYRAGWKVLGEELRDFVFFAAENKPPYLPRVTVLDDAAIEAGEVLARRGMERIAECVTAGKWPGWPTEASDAVSSLPSYGFTEAEEAKEQLR